MIFTWVLVNTFRSRLYPNRTKTSLKKSKIPISAAYTACHVEIKKIHYKKSLACALPTILIPPYFPSLYPLFPNPHPKKRQSVCLPADLHYLLPVDSSPQISQFLEYITYHILILCLWLRKNSYSYSYLLLYGSLECWFVYKIKKEWTQI